MKHFSFALLFAAGLFMLGCEEQSVNPIHVGKFPGAKLLEFEGSIKNAGVADFPANAEVKGSVLYTLRPVVLGKGATSIYDVGLETAARVIVPSEAVGGESYSAAGKSEERIELNQFGNATLSSAYRIEGISATAYLHIAFAADDSQLKFHKAWVSPTK